MYVNERTTTFLEWKEETEEEQAWKRFILLYLENAVANTRLQFFMWRKKFGALRITYFFPFIAEDILVESEFSLLIIFCLFTA